MIRGTPERRSRLFQRASRTLLSVPPVEASAASPFNMGTFFSGLETPPIAAKQIGLPTRCVFTIEISETLRERIARVWQPRRLHGDVNTDI